MSPEQCPHCEAPLPPRASSCKACGSDALTGWSPEAEDLGDLPGGYGGDGDFDYDEAIASELGPRRSSISAPMRLMALIALAAFVWLLMRGLPRS